MARGRLKVKWVVLDDGVLDVTLDASFPVKILPEMSHKQLADTIFRLGEKITLKLRPAAGKSMAVLVNNERISPVTSSDGVYTYTFAVKENTAVSFETKSVYKVSGTLPEELKNAAMYVIDENGES